MTAHHVETTNTSTALDRATQTITEGLCLLMHVGWDDDQRMTPETIGVLVVELMGAASEEAGQEVGAYVKMVNAARDQVPTELEQVRRALMRTGMSAERAALVVVGANEEHKQMQADPECPAVTTYGTHNPLVDGLCDECGTTMTTAEIDAVTNDLIARYGQRGPVSQEPF